MSYSDKYDAIVTELEKKNIPCKVKETETGLIIECGYDYPDRITEKVEDAAEKIGMPYNKLIICADSTGDTVLRSKSIKGGPKSYRK